MKTLQSTMAIPMGFLKWRNSFLWQNGGDLHGLGFNEKCPEGLDFYEGFNYCRRRCFQGKGRSEGGQFSLVFAEEIGIGFYWCPSGWVKAWSAHTFVGGAN